MFACKMKIAYLHTKLQFRLTYAIKEHRSYSMFYKVNNEPSLSELPVVYMNFRNLDILYSEMQRVISMQQ